MKNLKISHFFDVVKTEVACEFEDVPPLQVSAVKIKTEREYLVKEEIDIPWDESNSAVDKYGDRVYSSKKYTSVFNAVVIIDKLPDSIVQQHLNSKKNNTQVHKNIVESSGSDIVSEERTKDTNRDFSNIKSDSLLYWTICKTCGDKYEIFERTRQIHECPKGKNEVLYECKKCHKKLATINGIKHHVQPKYKCLHCDYESTKKVSALRHARDNHSRITSKTHSLIEKIECRSLQRGLENALEKFRCSKCKKEFQILPDLLRHTQICTETSCTSDRESPISNIKREKFLDRIIPFCKECDRDLTYNKSNETKKSIKIMKSKKRQCVQCKSLITYKCAEWKKQFTARYGVISHIRNRHDDMGQNYKCFVGDYTSHVFDRVVHHYRKQHIRKTHNCHVQFRSRQNFTKHLPKCGPQSLYNCDHCSYKSKFKSGLIKHIQCRHSTNLRLECPICKSTLKNKFCLAVHQNQCGKLRDFKCSDCSFRSQYKHNLKIHVLRIHSNDGEIECLNCKKVQKNGQCLKDHLQYCEKKDQFKCKKCTFKTRYAANLREHFTRIHRESSDIGFGHSAQPDYQCDYCLSKFKTKSDLYKHIVHCHLKERNVVCSRCSENFQNHIFLNKHLNYCGLKPYLYCKQCPFKTYLKGQLTLHVDRKHASFKCPKCHAKISRKDYLKRHMERSCKKRSEIL